MNVVIVGCGLIGEKRAKNLGGHKLVGAADLVLANARKVAGDWRE